MALHDRPPHSVDAFSGSSSGKRPSPFFVFLCIFSFSRLFSASKPALVRKSTSGQCNGYSDLCQRQFNKVAYATTHNSYAYGDQIAANQNKNIKSQLDAGIRGFMLDLHLESSVKLNRRDATLLAVSPTSSTTASSSSTGSSSTDPYLCHTTCLLLNDGPLINELRNFKTFLDANPNEVITIFIENDDNFTAAQMATQFKNASLDKYAFQPASTGSDFAWPTLQSMISSGKRLVIFTDGGADPSTVPWILYDKDYVVQTPYEVPVNSNFGCSPLTTVRPLWVMNHFVYANQTFGNGVVGKPDPTSAASVNALSSLQNQASICSKAGVFPNFVTVDFYDQGDVLKAVAGINGVTYRDTSTSTFGNQSSDPSSASRTSAASRATRADLPLTLAGAAAAAVLSVALSAF
ncbi:PLC-like phosphodiesterase [Martensiomyces pterosporus]|nr:PLC-like phosphodiesterase [Martensiomyces pterosporus]